MYQIRGFTQFLDEKNLVPTPKCGLFVGTAFLLTENENLSEIANKYCNHITFYILPTVSLLAQSNAFANLSEFTKSSQQTNCLHPEHILKFLQAFDIVF